MNRRINHSFNTAVDLSWDEYWEVVSFVVGGKYYALVEYAAPSQHEYIADGRVEWELIEFTLPADPK